jgi:hypothetical protein
MYIQAINTQYNFMQTKLMAMKLLLSFTLLAALGMQAAAQSQSYLIAEATYDNYNKQIDSTDISYDHNKQHYDSTLRTWNYNKADWYNYFLTPVRVASRTLNTFNSNMQPITTVYEVSNSSGTFAPEQRTTYTYNTDGLISSTRWERNLQSGPLQDSKTTTTYDANKRKELEVWEYWDGTAFKESSKREFQYNTAGQVEAIHVFNKQGGNWMIVSRTTYTYNGGKMVEYLSEQNTAGVWNPTTLVLYTYNANGDLATYEQRTWQSGTWQNNLKWVYEYNKQNWLTGYIYQTWSLGAYTNVTKTAYEYNAYGQEVVKTDSTWNSTSQKFEWGMNNKKTLYYYKDVPGSVGHTASTNTLKIYPVPAGDVINISRTRGGQAATVSLIDMSGRVVKTAMADAPVSTMNVSDLPAGQYIITVQDERSVTSQQVTIIH